MALLAPHLFFSMEIIGEALDHITKSSTTMLLRLATALFSF
jgi:hypothetical protein